ncbi:MAG: hypothetical protein EXS37_00815 [Opitutus sp.]|nr:hypothetical protein [Opitutus sp.]
MNLRLLELFRSASDRPRLLAFAASAVAAVAIGFRVVPPPVAEKLIAAGGYYYILFVFAAFVAFGWRVAAPRRAVWQAWLRRPGWAGLALLAAVGFAVWADEFKHKILFDEYVLQGTAWHMHATKEIGAPIRAYDIWGTWLAIDVFLDKRPYFFTFLLSLLHDLSGFRLQNVFGLNVAMAAVCLALTYWLGQALTGRRGPALLAMALLATMPLFGQNATGAGMEMHNLAMIAVVMTCAVLYLRAPDPDRLALLVLATVLLAQSRYESVLFVGPVALIILLGWWRRGTLLLPWPAVVAPLLLVPYAWHDRIVDTKKVLWQLREGETSRFAFGYLQGNLEGAWKFFFGTSPGQPNSLWLTLLGCAGLGWAIVRLGSRWYRPREVRVPLAASYHAIALCGLAILANVVLLLFYYWSRFDEPIAARFALPSCLLLAIVAGWFVHSLDARRLPATRLAALGLGGWFLVFAAPAYSRRIYTSQNLVMRELEWEIERVTARPGPLLLITQKATMPFLLLQVSTVNTASVRTRGEQIAWHMRAGTFREVLVSQVIRPTTAQGDAGVDPDEVLPEEFRLQTLEQKRFGARWIRISRLVEIVPTPPASPAGAGSD